MTLDGFWDLVWRSEQMTTDESPSRTTETDAATEPENETETGWHDGDV